MTFEKVTKASGTLGFLLGQGIQRGAPPTGSKSSNVLQLSTCIQGGRHILVGSIALLGLGHAYKLYTKKTPW